ncbi:MAG: TonB-dependent receptor plug domain-containing protein, partial [Pseudomonadota bacterium]
MTTKLKLLTLSILLAQQSLLLAQPSQEAEEAEVESATEAAPLPGGVEEIAVIAKFIPQEKRSTATISNVLDAAAFTVAGDSNVADGLKRMAGLNLQGGKFIYVRGLGERYSSTVLNGSTLPSPEPINRVVPLDLFPASIIDSVLVQKTYSAKFPAEFAGGTVQMRTKVAPEYNFFKLSSSVGYSGGTTGKDGLVYRGGDDDWQGVDDGTRDMSGVLKTAIANDRELRLNNRFYTKGFSAAELETLGESLSNNYSVQQQTIKPDRGIGANFGRAWELMDGDTRVGMLGNISYNSAWDTLNVTRNSYAADAVGDLSPADVQMWNATTETVDTSMFLTTGLEFRDNQKIKATVLQIHKMDDLAGQLTGELVSQDEIIRQNRL